MAKQYTTQKTVSTETLQFIRESQIKFKITDLKPRTVLYAYFDGISVTDKIVPDVAYESSGKLITNDAGTAEGTFIIPPYTFTTGTKTLVFIDSDVYISGTDAIVAGYTGVYASVKYITSGKKETVQKTNVTVTTVNRYR